MFSCLILFLLIDSGHSKEQDCVRKSDISPYTKLKDDLFCNYDSSVRPVKDIKNQTSIKFRLYPTFIDMTEHSNIFEFHTWIQMVWSDEFLQWDPANYSNIKYLHTSASNVWVPDLFDFNRAVPGDDIDFGTMETTISYNGKVYLSGLAELKSYCKMDVSRWPHDRHTCGSTIGSRSYLGHQLDLIINNSSINLTYYTGSGNWKLEQAFLMRSENYFLTNSTLFHITLRTNFTIKRLSSTLVAALAVPIITMSSLNLANYWQHPLEISRFATLLVSLALHITILQYLSWMVPINSNSPIVVMTFLEYSLAICTTSFIILLLQQRFISDSPLPLWLDQIRLKLINSPTSWFLLSQTKPCEGTDEESIINNSTPRYRKEWLVILSAFDRMMFCFLIIVYIIMMCLAII